MTGCDCYVSLHRSEGFGLTLAEAMAYGRPVIATAYSGNLDFMDEHNSYLVPFRESRSRLVPTLSGGAVPGAEPDLDEAARLTSPRLRARRRGPGDGQPSSRRKFCATGLWTEPRRSSVSE